MTEIYVAPGLFLVDKPTGLLRWARQFVYVNYYKREETRWLQQEFEIIEYIGDVPTNRRFEWRDVPVVSIGTSS